MLWQMNLRERVRQFDEAEWGPRWLRRLAGRLSIAETRHFRDHQEKQRFVLGAILVLALLSIVAGIAGGESAHEAARAFLRADAAYLFLGTCGLLTLIRWAAARRRRRKAG